MKIRMKTSIGGNGYSFAPGEVVDADAFGQDGLAQRLVDRDMAELVEDEPNAAKGKAAAKAKTVARGADTVEVRG